jgi:hypothetical protein
MKEKEFDKHKRGVVLPLNDINEQRKAIRRRKQKPFEI